MLKTLHHRHRLAASSASSRQKLGGRPRTFRSQATVNSAIPSTALSAVQTPRSTSRRSSCFRSTMSSSNTSSSRLPVVAFYSGGEDDEGRTLDEMLLWPLSKLEYHHDYIQWMFPLPERSPINPYAPVFDQATTAMFTTKPHLQSRLRDSLILMLTFYGFESNLLPSSSVTAESPHPGNITITQNPETFPRAARNWFNSHNDLRITRIIRCLRCAGLDAEAAAFYSALKEVYDSRAAYPNPIGKRSFMYWTRAAKRPLAISPDMSEEEAERLLRKLSSKGPHVDGSARKKSLLD